VTGLIQLRAQLATKPQMIIALAMESAAVLPRQAVVTREVVDAGQICVRSLFD
jgi:hypothetical protein